MKRWCVRIGLICWIIALLTGCTGGVSKYARSQVSYFEPFGQLQQQPEKYRGETVIWGGRIISSTALKGATEIEVLQLDLNHNQRPISNDQSQGRFIIRSAAFIDPALYPKGTLITVVGPLKGSENRAIDRMPYQYPVIGITEIKKWPKGTGASPRFHFGIGISTYF